MKSFVRRLSTSTLLVGALICGAATAAASAIVYPPEGGTWDRGAGTEYVWSDYNHTICHSSTSVGRTTETDTASSGWTITKVRAKVFGNETYYATTSASC